MMPLLQPRNWGDFFCRVFYAVFIQVLNIYFGHQPIIFSFEIKNLNHTTYLTYLDTQ